jgi:hypothetical protein
MAVLFPSSQRSVASQQEKSIVILNEYCNCRYFMLRYLTVRYVTVCFLCFTSRLLYATFTLPCCTLRYVALRCVTLRYVA